MHRKIHTNEKLEKIYVCEIYKKTFAYYSYLKVHDKAYTGEKPFKCKE